MPVVDVRDLKVVLTDTGADIVDAISFSIDAGTVLGLVGESGSGKSTVATSLLGYTRPGARLAGGQIVIDGADVATLPLERLRTLRGSVVAYVPQDPSAALNPSLRLGRQLGEMLSVHAAEKSSDWRVARMRAVLSEVKLPSDEEFLRRYPHQVSGGQQQRLAIAMAFILRPKVIVLDEPTTGLDVTTQAHVLATVRELCTTHGVAAMYVSHDLAVVAGLADRVLVLYAGRTAEIGSAGRVFDAAAHPYTQKLLGAIPSVSESRRLEPIPGYAPVPGKRPTGCSFAPRCPHAQDRCRLMTPELEEIAPGHLARCLRVHELAAHRATTELRRVRTIARSAVPLLEIAGLSMAYGEREVLSGVSLEVHPEECLALVGESGSGKTTLARCAVGLTSGWEGEIRFRGTPVSSRSRARPDEVRRRLQYIFQSPYNSLHPRRSIGETIATPVRQFSALSRREARVLVAKALEDVSLPAELGDAYPAELSGGERQRVAIARALICDPDVLICDEVTSALDVSVQAAIVRLLDQLRQERSLALLFVTHDLALVRSIADRVAVLNHGRIVEAGQVAHVLHQPADEYTRLLIDDTPKLRDAPSASPPPPVDPPNGGVGGAALLHHSTPGGIGC
jgi:peptide/nickel transport system ATP-binding protein